MFIYLHILSYPWYYFLLLCVNVLKDSEQKCLFTSTSFLTDWQSKRKMTTDDRISAPNDHCNKQNTEMLHYCKCHVYAVIIFCDSTSMWSFWVETNMRNFVLFSLFIHISISYVYVVQFRNAQMSLYISIVVWLFMLSFLLPLFVCL